MRKLLTVAALALLLPLSANAQARFGGKLGLGIPMGEVSDGFDLSSATSLAIPLEVNATFALAPNVYLGGYGGLAFDAVGSDISDYCDFYGYTCTQHTWRLGVKGEFALGDVNQGFAPYVGANFGWEWHVTKTAGGGDWIKETLSGWELGLEAGADTRMSEGFTAGVFVNLAFGKFGHYAAKDSAGNTFDQDIDSSMQAMHQWLTIGVRGNFDLGPAR